MPPFSEFPPTRMHREAKIVACQLPNGASEETWVNDWAHWQRLRLTPMQTLRYFMNAASPANLPGIGLAPQSRSSGPLPYLLAKL
mmetsp:Transcript_68321/g.158562  ORF Transcript_68321/g.158562 Transcript_68321/m.158562 type:complete len:85 (-) Transcript_68321:1341-1595(-)